MLILVFWNYRTTDIPNESESSSGTQKRCIQEISHDEKEKLLATSVYKSRKEIIQKYGYSQFAIWFQEESFFNYWQVHGFGGVPLYEINLAKRRKLRGEKFKKKPEKRPQQEGGEDDGWTQVRKK